ncbi:MAG: ExbD/TolR family protein [Planctomycetota bacterium]
MAIRLKELDDAGLDLTPMIDMVFNLLIFFLLATTLQQNERELKVSVPQAESGRNAVGGRDPIVVNVMSDGRVIVRGNAVTLEQLRVLLSGAVAESPETKALIRADAKLPFEKVIVVADVCVRANAAFAFATLRPEESR